KGRWVTWMQPLSAAELQDRTFDFYKTWAAARENAGGPMNPLFFSTNITALANTPIDQIAILQFKPIAGAMGTRESALGEWRTYSGNSVQFVGKVDPYAKTASVRESSDIVKEASDFAKFAFLIEVPKESRGHFWDEPPAHNLEFWAFRDRPPVLINEKIYFTFDKMPVAETTCLRVEKPGESICELTGKYEKHWKLYWEPKKFVKYAGTTAPTLYHGTCPENAAAIMENGWQPNQVSSGGNAGQPQYLYLTNFPENAQWFANEKGCDTILEVRNIPMSYLQVDPEDGTEDTVERELNFSEKAFPGTVVLTKPLPANHFKVFRGKVASAQ